MARPNGDKEGNPFTGLIAIFLVFGALLIWYVLSPSNRAGPNVFETRQANQHLTSTAYAVTLAVEHATTDAYRTRAAATPTRRPAATATQFVDINCDEFVTRRHAQDFFEATSGPRRDPYGLDPDGDGVACETYPDDFFIPRRWDGVRDLDCDDFNSRWDAQEFFESLGGPTKDPHYLDGDGDGWACEALP